MGRAYDSKFISHGMHRLGNFAQPNTTLLTLHARFPLPPTNPRAVQNMRLGTVTDDPRIPSTSTPCLDSIQNLCAFPCEWRGGSFVTTSEISSRSRFQGEPYAIVQRHIQGVVSADLSRALATLEHGTSALVSSGMITFNAKLMGIDDDKFVSRVVEMWGFFWGHALLNVEEVGLWWLWHPYHITDGSRL